MTDYNKQTVAQLRALLKERHLPSTGLTRKAQIVEKLEEADSAPAGGAGEVPEKKGDETSPASSSVTMGAEDARPKSGSGDAEGEKKGVEAVEESTSAEAKEESAVGVEASPVKEVSPVKEASAPVKEPTPRMKESIPPAEEPTPTRVNPPTPPPAENEAQTIEKEIPLPTVREEPSVEPSVEPSRLNSEELEADTRKRKRRSESPDVKADDVRSKKLRASGEGLEPAVEEVVHMEKDTIMEDEPEKDKVDTDVVMEDKPAEVEVPKEDSNDSTKDETKAGSEDTTAPESKTTAPAPIERERDTEKENSARYKNIFERPAATAASPPADADPDRPVSPSLHPATPALYIRNFMRPLQPAALRTHLIALASPPSSEPNPTLLKTFFLDPIRTHAFALFDSITAAARVRGALHGAVWPAERDRKELWVDFVPEERVESWIEIEEEASRDSRGGRGGAKRWHVSYQHTDADGSIKAVFQEVGAGGRGSIDISARRAGADGLGMPNAPTGPRSPVERRGAPAFGDRATPRSEDAVETSKPDPTKSFQTLDKLFRSTTAKPKLYFLPVEPARVDARLDALKAATSRNWDPESSIRGRGRGRLDEKRRYGFDGAADGLMELGPDFGPGAVEGWGGRGGYRGRGGFRGDSFRGDSYRGGGMAGRLDRDGEREFGGGYRGGRGGWRGRSWD